MIKKCINCDSEFNTILINKAKFCSDKCRSQFKRKNNPEGYDKNMSFILRYYKKIKCIEYLGGKCEKCGDTNIFHLVFHHNTDEKDFDISDIWGKHLSDIKKELKKCILLCDNCHRELHFDKIIDNNKFRKSKEIFVEYKGNKCNKCGYNKCLAALTFHHLDKNEKDFDIGSICVRIDSLNNLNESLIKELDKCELLCTNCHRELHVDIERFEKFKEQIYKNRKETNKKINRELVKKLYLEGKKQIEIANILDCSKGNISSMIKKIKLELTKN